MQASAESRAGCSAHVQPPLRQTVPVYAAADLTRPKLLGGEHTRQEKLNRELLTTLGATGSDYCPAATGLHADQEPVSARALDA